MAVDRVLLAAHHRDSVLPGSIAKPHQTSLEFWCIGHPSVKDMAFTIKELVAVGSTTEFPAKEYVLYSPFHETELEISAIELRVEFRERSRAHVSNYLDVVRLQQIEEGFQRLRGVPSRKQLRVTHVRSSGSSTIGFRSAEIQGTATTRFIQAGVRFIGLTQPRLASRQ